MTQEQPTLKPCPFCGGAAQFYPDRLNMGSVRCETGCRATVWGTPHIHAADLWNRRATDPRLEAAMALLVEALLHLERAMFMGNMTPDGASEERAKRLRSRISDFLAAEPEAKG